MPKANVRFHYVLLAVTLIKEYERLATSLDVHMFIALQTWQAARDPVLYLDLTETRLRIDIEHLGNGRCVRIV